VEGPLIPHRFFASALFFLTALNGRGGEQSVLWKAPGATTVNDWIWGPGGEGKAPKPPFEFLEEDHQGTNPKIRVLDAKDDRWTVKFGGENHSEVFASRLLYAVGYLTEPTYYVASGTLTDVHDIKRAKPFVARDGSFRFARFKLHHSKKVSRVLGLEWSWTDNPFVGSHELNGLKILMMLMSNWDAKDSRDGNGSNTAVYSKPGPFGDQLYYAFDDWGATLGRWGGFFERDKWNPEGYRQQTKSFVRAAPGGRIEWGYRGKRGQDITSGISVDDVRWLLTYLSPVTDEELRAGLRASGATEVEIKIYARSMRERIAQLQRLAFVSGLATAAVNQGYN
jgi:hypothetical protein